MKKCTIVMIIIVILFGLSSVIFPQFFDSENLNTVALITIVIAFFAVPCLSPLFFENNPFKDFSNKKQITNTFSFFRLIILLVVFLYFLIKKYDLLS